MGRFRIPPEVAAQLQEQFRRRRLVAIATAAVMLGGVGVALWLARAEAIDLDRCTQLYAEADDAADTLRIDKLTLDLGDARDPERGGKEPVRCRVARD